MLVAFSSETGAHPESRPGQAFPETLGRRQAMQVCRVPSPGCVATTPHPVGFPEARSLVQDTRHMMDDRRDPSMRDPLDPTMHQMAREDAINRSNTGMGWIAGAVFLVVVLALIFGLGRGDRTATNDTTPPATTTGAA